MDLYIFHDNQQSGPFPLEAVRDMVRVGTIPSSVLVWYEGAPDWTPLATVLPPEAPSLSNPAARAIAVPRRSQPRPGTFFSLLPGAFGYPFKRNGVILLVTGTVFFGLLDLASRFAFLYSIPLAIFSTGYLFAFMQRIIVSSAQGDQEMPSWPEFSEWYQDIILPFVQFAVLMLLCLGPGRALLGLGWGARLAGGDSTLLLAGGVLLVAGSFYLPMALLGVAMADSTNGMNPLVIVPSILKVLGPYLTVWLVLAVVIIVEKLSAQLLPAILPIPLVPAALTGFFSLYFLTVEMRILGLLYYTNQERLKWF